jgi:hypothetical protein
MSERGRARGLTGFGGKTPGRSAAMSAWQIISSPKSIVLLFMCKISRRLI